MPATYVFYYQHTDGKTKLVTVRGRYPPRDAPLWKNKNTSVLLCPGTDDAREDDDQMESR